MTLGDRCPRCAPGSARSRRRRGRGWLVAVVAVVLAACGEGTSDGNRLAGVEVVVGSKQFAEQELLGSMFVQALEARGADVTDATGTGDTAETRAALLAGTIDAYVEYDTTAWFELLGRSDPPPPDPPDITAAVAELDLANGVVWLGRSAFDNAYGFAVGPSLAEDLRADRYRVESFDLDGLAALLAAEGDLVVCVAPEFRARPDGLARFEAATGFSVPDERLRTLDTTADVADGLLTGRCDVGEVFTTSGLVDANGLLLVRDSGVFAPYHAALTVRLDVYEQAPTALRELAEQILRPLTQDRMIDLNRRVIEGESVEDVALDHLRRFDIVG